MAAFLTYLGECTKKHVAAQLGMGASTIVAVVEEVARLLHAYFKDETTFHMDEIDVCRSMMGSNKIAGLPNCVGAIGGSHIPWHRCTTK